MLLVLVERLLMSGGSIPLFNIHMLTFSNYLFFVISYDYEDKSIHK